MQRPLSKTKNNLRIGNVITSVVVKQLQNLPQEDELTTHPVVDNSFSEKMQKDPNEKYPYKKITWDLVEKFLLPDTEVRLFLWVSVTAHISGGLLAHFSL